MRDWRQLMPVTPFHGGIGLLAKSIAGPRFSFLGFCATQVAIDLESGFHLLRDDWPYHRFFHTFAGAALVCAIAVVTARLVGLRWPAASTRAPTLNRLARDDLRALVPASGAVATGAIGLLGHVIPDAIMHGDVRPFAPLTDTNPFHAAVSLPLLHGALVLIGALGALAWLAREAGPSGRRD